MRSAEEMVDLCRLARLPHELLAELGLMPRLTGYAALYFDLSYIRASKIVRAFDHRDRLSDGADKDIFGTLGINKALTALLLRS